MHKISTLKRYVWLCQYFTVPISIDSVVSNIFHSLIHKALTWHSYLSSVSPLTPAVTPISIWTPVAAGAEYQYSPPDTVRPPPVLLAPGASCSVGGGGGAAATGRRVCERRTGRASTAKLHGSSAAAQVDASRLIQRSAQSKARRRRRASLGSGALASGGAAIVGRQIARLSGAARSVDSRQIEAFVVRNGKPGLKRTTRIGAGVICGRVGWMMSLQSAVGIDRLQQYSPPPRRPGVKANNAPAAY